MTLNRDEVNVYISDCLSQDNRGGSMKEDFVWFFAYGSAMNSTRLAGRGVKFYSIEPAYIDNYQLKFNKRSVDGTAKANIVPATDEKVYGLLYKLPKSELHKLDNIEGLTSGHYYRTSMQAITMDGEVFMAEVYIANAKYLVDDEKAVPSEQHISTVFNAAVKNKFDPEYINYLKSFHEMA